VSAAEAVVDAAVVDVAVADAADEHRTFAADS
jgi:hypothetical protein